MGSWEQLLLVGEEGLGVVSSVVLVRLAFELVVRGRGVHQIVQACDVPVAKHGNRSVSSTTGSADVLEAAGVNLNLSVQQIEQCIKDSGIGFLFAPAHHAATKHAVAQRKEIGLRTFFNLLGPLTNPAEAPP